jgi:ABC-type sugar transport system ATPase subunit
VFDVAFEDGHSVVNVPGFGSLGFDVCGITSNQAASGTALGIRAESFDIIDGSESDSLVGVVDLVEKLGDLTVVYIRSSINQGGQVVTVKTVGDLDITAGDEVGLRPNGPIMVFDKGGTRIGS